MLPFSEACERNKDPILAVLRGSFADRTQVLEIGTSSMCVYGPFRHAGAYTLDSNREFDRILKERDPSSGLRDLEAVAELAAQYGVHLREDRDLPAYNRLLVFTKEP